MRFHVPMLKRLFKPKLLAGDVVMVADHPVRLAVNPRARRITLRVDLRRGEIVAVAPHDKLLSAAVDFAASQPGWIATRLARMPKSEILCDGGPLLWRGQTLRLQSGAKRAHVADGIVYVRGAPARAGSAALAFLKAQARMRAHYRVMHYAALLGTQVAALRLADPKARWGSCTSDGRIMLSWRLIMAPDHVFDYVAAHEVCHLRHPDHSPAFWATVGQLYGDVGPAKSWLRAHGGRLHAIRGR